MENAPENAIIIYSDTGFIFRNPLKDLIDSAKKNEIVLVKYNPKYYGYVKTKTQQDTT